MPNSKELFSELVSRIHLPESKEEIESMVYAILDARFGLSRAEVMSRKEITVNGNLDEIIDRLNQFEPLQYVLGESHFYGRRFIVTPAVLIPRPETELLVQHVKEEAVPGTRMLDIGTGSGCIAVTLALEIPGSEIFAVDISSDAVAVAQENAKQLGAVVHFQQADIFKGLPAYPPLDFVVSNPPYITADEKHSMTRQVVDYEPSGALFVPGHDPLLYYREIARLSKRLLKTGGKVAVEINERFGNEVAALFKLTGYGSVSVYSDLDGKPRIVMATYS